MLPVVTEPRDAVLTPAIRTAPGMIVRQVTPRVTPRAIVLAYSAPLPFGNVRSPAPPFLCGGLVLGQAPLFGGRFSRSFLITMEVFLQSNACHLLAIGLRSGPLRSLRRASARAKARNILTSASGVRIPLCRYRA